MAVAAGKSALCGGIREKSADGHSGGAAPAPLGPAERLPRPRQKLPPLPPAQTAAPAEQVPLLGFIVEDDGQMPAYMMMHGFLRTAENLGYPAKLYRAAPGAEAQEAVARALEEGCDALLIQNSDGANDGALGAAYAGRDLYCSSL